MTLAEQLKNEGFQQGIQQGQIQLALEGIETILDIKFGKKGVKLIQEIRNINDINRLKEIMKAIKSIEDLTEIKGLVN